MPTGVFRPNLRLEVQTTHNEPDKRQHLVRLVRDFEGTGIVYAASVRQVDLLYRLLYDVGLMAARDHRRMPRRQRLTELARFDTDKVQAIVATSMFAMHVSKPDVRFVLHYALPDSIDAYYDEASRAGLDARPAHCVILYDPYAARADDEFVSGDTPSPAVVSALYSTLARLGADGRLVPRTDVTDKLTAFGRNEARDAIAMLKAHDVIEEARGLKLRLRRPGLDEGQIAALVAEHATQHRSERHAREELIAYAETAECRWKALLAHFHEEVTWERCGTCDNCRRRDGQTAPRTPGAGPLEDAAPASPRAAEPGPRRG